MNSLNDYIAVLDSGVGGISVLRCLLQQMPHERFLFFGDSANAPYGTRSKSQVRELTLAAASRLVARGVKALVVACNTATAAAIEDLRAAYPNVIVIGIEPALKPAADRFPGGSLGVMATELTLHEEKYDHLLHRFDQRCQIYPIRAPGLVELIEAGHGTDARARALLSPILTPFAGKLDALVLGCTHYPFAAPVIRQLLPGTMLFDGGDGTARETKRRLAEAGLLREGEGSLILENSSPDPALITLCRKLLYA